MWPIDRVFDQASCWCRISIVEPVESHTKLSVNQEGLAVLRSISGPVIPVVVIGPYRSGKSFLLNQLLGVGCSKLHVSCIFVDTDLIGTEAAYTCCAMLSACSSIHGTWLSTVLPCSTDMILQGVRHTLLSLVTCTCNVFVSYLLGFCMCIHYTQCLMFAAEATVTH